MAKQIMLTHGAVTTVDDEDFDVLNRWKWHINDSGYALRREYPSRKFVRMHREIINVPDGLYVDHINGDRLDNRRENLRICTKAQNQRNQGRHTNARSRFKGICFDQYLQRWTAYVTVNYKRISLGTHATEEEAARAYDRAAREHHGDFARLNFPDEVA